MLLLPATISLMVPTISSLNTRVSSDSILKLSRGTAILLILAYGIFTFFRLKGYANWFQEKAQLSVKRKAYSKRKGDAL